MNKRVAPATFLTLLALLVGAFAPAQAAVPNQPAGLAPDVIDIQGAPVLSWNRVSAATSYEVQVGTDPDFGSGTVKYSTTTVNRRVVPTSALPFDTVHWRVRASNSSGKSDWSTAYFNRSRLAGPNLLAPANDEQLDQPREPVLLSWAPVPGAISYEVELDTDASFDLPLLRKDTGIQTTSFLEPLAGLENTYFWRVRAVVGSNLYSEYSDVWSYTTTGLDKPVLTSPMDSPLTAVDDIVLDWEPVEGAKSYNIQVSTEEDFLTVDHSASTYATQYSPPTTLTNDQYYWRVQPVDTLGNKLAWSTVDTWEFKRQWPDQPALEYPGNNAVVGDPMFFQWTPVHLASRYQLQIANDADFQSIYDTCTTTNTTFTPYTASNCHPQAAGTYYWRVLAFDDPRNPAVQSEVIFSPIRKFSYAPAMVDLGTATPLNGTSSSLPILKWGPVAGAAYYKVYLYNETKSDSVVGGTNTYATTYTPRTKLKVGDTYRWYVRTVSGDGRLGAALTTDAWSRFTVTEAAAATAQSPEPVSPADGYQTERFPNLRWTPVQNATRYTVSISRVGDITAPALLPDDFDYPAGEDTRTTYLNVGTYTWTVKAYNGSAFLSETQNPGTFEVVPVPATENPRVALSGMAAMTAGQYCGAVLPQRCERVRHSPVLKWAPIAGAGLYRLSVYRDAARTELLKSYDIDNTMFAFPAELTDSQAADAYYWTVEACKKADVCRTTINSPARWAFNKKSNQVEETVPGVWVNTTGEPLDENGKVDTSIELPEVADEITFSWKDYLETNYQDPSSDELDDFGQRGRSEARKYLVQVSTKPNFQTILDSEEVDQTTYTAYDKAYPEGVLYWRVQAKDGSDNPLSFSKVKAFVKKSPAPALVAMPNGGAVTGSQPFRWQPLDFAAGYDIEVYKNDDTLAQPANQVVKKTSTQAALVLSSDPLPVAGTAYRWRVRKYDASGNRSAWSSLTAPEAKITVVGASPTLSSPANGVYLRGNDGLFSWKAVARAAKYRFERRKVGTTTLSESPTTVALAWAPTKAIADGSWEWRVVALDSKGRQMGVTSWRGFKVDSGRPTVTSKSPTGNVSTTTNFTVRFSERVTNVTGSTFRIFRSGTPDPLPAKVTLSSTGTSAVLNPSSNLARGKTYYVRLTTGIKDPAGNTLVATSWKVVGK